MAVATTASKTGMRMDTVPTNEFGRRLVGDLKKRGWNLPRLVIEIANKGFDPLGYEHLRKIVRGHQLPSPSVVHRVSKVLGWDRKEIEQLVAEERVRLKVGGTLRQLTNEPPWMDEWKMVLKELTPSQREDFKRQIVATVRGNRKRAAERAQA
jgi:hypothetical protein